MLLAEVGVFHDVLAGVAEDGVVDVERCANRAAAVSGRRLHVELLERRLPEDPAIGHAVQGHAAGHAEAGKARLGMESQCHGEERLLCDELDAGCNVGVVLVLPAEFCVIGRLVTEVGRIP